MNTPLIVVGIVALIALIVVLIVAVVRIVRFVAGALRMSDEEIFEAARKAGLPVHDRQRRW
jgi:ABC-type proline/glycine betaine transport system permease subunit